MQSILSIISVIYKYVEKIYDLLSEMQLYIPKSAAFNCLKVVSQVPPIFLIVSALLNVYNIFLTQINDIFSLESSLKHEGGYRTGKIKRRLYFQIILFKLFSRTDSLTYVLLHLYSLTGCLLATDAF